MALPTVEIHGLVRVGELARAAGLLPVEWSCPLGADAVAFLRS
ncbi:hypothetical protein ACH4TV_30245 [Streptomyces sp. NPDC020898]